MAEILKYIEKRLDELGDNNPSELTPKSEGLPFCLGCGQKIDWSEEK